MPRLSIIVPVYNAEPWLRRCVDSILSQTFTDLEAILVDDGSTDGSAGIIDDYTCRDPRIVAVRQDNRGVSQARNAGLEAARGEFVGFVDSDDWIEPDMYARMVETMGDGCDLSVCGWFVNDEPAKPIGVKPARDLLTREEVCSLYVSIPPRILGSCCNKLFRRDRIRGGFDGRYAICEDNLFLARYSAQIRGARCIDAPLYHIVTRPDSATRIQRDRSALGLPAREEIIDVMGTVSEACRQKAERVFLNQCVSFCRRGGDPGSEYYRLARDCFLMYLKKHRILSNREMGIKQKLFFCLNRFRLTCERGKTSG